MFLYTTALEDVWTAKAQLKAGRKKKKINGHKAASRENFGLQLDSRSLPDIRMDLEFKESKHFVCNIYRRK